MKLIGLITLFCVVVAVCGHGRLIEPPGRSTAWRYGFNTPKNYNDNELFCGGFTIQWGVNGGKCGICGDPYNGERQNELPNGIYAKNLVVTRSYSVGATITAKVQITANHDGYFQFKLCRATTRSVEVTQECLDRNVLEVLNSNNKYKYNLPSRSPQTFDVQLKLPSGLSCDRCVLQWTYTAANNWGRCEDGSHAVGCGNQETFRGCADIKIGNEKSVKNVNKTPNELEKPDRDKNVPKTRDSKVTQNGRCVPIGVYRNNAGMSDWCNANCKAGFCPANMCSCS